MERNYVAFISYRHAEMDSAIAKTLHTSIEQYRIPKGLQKDGNRRLGLVFRDEEELHAASDLTAEIQEALRNTEFLIVICSENSIQSPWVSREIEYFLQHHDRSKVLALLASGEPVDVFPNQLTHLPDGQIIEPLAVDVRADTLAEQKKKLRKELPRLISGILDCPYDALIMREQKRKMRRITGIAAGAMAILLGFTSMVLAKNQEIELANTQLEHKNTELNDANTALAEQKAAVQLRESQLLVQNAKDTLANADYIGTVTTALAALPESKSDNRPYYAPAENVLMDALGIFQTGDPTTELNKTTLVQVTDIAEYVINTDGTRIVAVDAFGTVVCFDTVSGEQLWHQYAAPEENGILGKPHLFICADEKTVIRNTKKAVDAYDLMTGHSLWSVKTDHIVEDYLFYNSVRNSLLLATSRTTDIFSTDHNLVEINTATGEVVQTIPFYTQDNSFVLNFSSSYTETRSRGGKFSKDGTQFYGVFFDNTLQMRCFLADLTKGTSQFLYIHDTPMLYNTEILGLIIRENGICNIVCKDPGEETMLCVMAVDFAKGKQLWRQDIPCPDMYSSSRYAGFAEFYQDGILLACHETFFYLDAATGQLLCSKSVPSKIMSLAFVSDTEFGFSLENGSYGIGWPINNELSLTTDSNWQAYASLDTPKVLQVWGGGIVQLFLDNDSFWLGIGNFRCPGYVSLIPKNATNTIQIVRVVESLCALSHTTLELPDNTVRVSTDSGFQKVGSQLAIGPLYNAADYSKLYHLMDPVTQKITKTLIPQSSYSSGSVFWIPETLQPLICTYSDGIFLLDDNNNQTMIYDYDDDKAQLAEEDNWWSAPALFINTSQYLSDGRTLLTAVCNPKTLRVWKNGSDMFQTQLPEHLVVPAKENSGMERLLKIGANGWILTSLHAYSSTIAAKSMAVYHPDQDLWTSFSDESVFSDEKAFAFAQSKPLMAGVDLTGNMQIYDLRTGKIVGNFPTQLPPGSVLNMQFFLNDTHLAIKAAGGHLLIYEIATGTQVYRDQLSNATSYTLNIYEDHIHDRLYLDCGSDSGLCLEMDSWTALAYPKTLMYYDSRSDLTYLKGPYSGNSPIVYAEIPDTMELVDLAASFISE